MREEPPLPEPAPPPILVGRTRVFVARWCERPIRATWGWLQGFSGLAWPGFALGALGAALAACAGLGWVLNTGLGKVLDMLLALVAGGVAILVLGTLAVLARALLASWPWRLAFALLGSFATLGIAFWTLDLPLAPALAAAAALILVAGGLGGGIAALLRGTSKTWGTLAGACLSILVALGLGTALVVQLRDPGTDPYLQAVPPARTVDAIQAPNPGVPGLWKTFSFTYGSGTDRHRREFGSQATYRTPSVDASLLLPGFKGLKASLRKRYWGFGKDAYPLNARVTCPEGKGPFPLVLAVHGNHTAQDFSDGGYQYLAELLASRGFLFVAVDENFLNGSWEGGVDQENAARAWILLKHLEVWRAWNGTQGHPLQGKVDLAEVALIGHSRGGEAVALAAAFNRLPCDPENAKLTFDFDFAIKAVAAIAPIDGQYDPSGLPIPMENTSYFVLQGSHDSDVAMFAGQRPYRRARFTEDSAGFKAALWIYRANHGQFNTTWGRHDAAPPRSWLLSTASLMDGENQRRIAQVFLSGFLETTLHGREEYLPMFRDPATAAAWLPKALLLNQFEDASFRPVATFDEGLDLTRTTPPGGAQRGENLAVWREKVVLGRGNWSFQDKAVSLGWIPGKVPSYTIELPAKDWALALTSRLVFSLADTDEDPVPGTPPPAGRKDPIDLTVELVAGDGNVARVPLSRLHLLQPVVKVRLTKWSALDRILYPQNWEPVFQTFELPLALFKEGDPSWSPKDLKEIRFVFDRTPRGLVLLDEVGFSR